MHRNSYFAVVSCSLMFVAINYDHRADASFVRNGNTYEVSYGGEFGSSPGTSRGYEVTIEGLINDYKRGKIEIETLNKFQNGLYQYFLLTLLEKKYTETISKLPENEIPDPIAVPDYVDDEIAIKDVVVYGFPAFQRVNKPEPIQELLESETDYKVTVRYNSDAILFVGSFYIARAKYFFVYNLKKNAFSVKTHVSSTSEIPISTRRVVEFDNEDLTHTYDSSRENHLKIDKLVSKTLTDKFIPSALDFLSVKVGDFIKRDILKTDLRYISSRKNDTLAAVVSSARLYADSKKLDTIEAEPFNFTNMIGSRVHVQGYSDIKVSGILNHDKPEIVNSTVFISDDAEVANISTAIRFTYSQEGAKEAYVSFKLTSGNRESATKMRIQSITIVAVYNCKLREKPYKVVRNKEVFYNGSGFLVLFDVDNYNLLFENLLRHVGNTIAKGIQNVLENEVA